MLDDFKTHVSNDFPELLKGPFLLACSGGIDSVVLAHLCHSLNMDFSLAHCNFNLRGDASDGDELFVKELAEKLNRPLYVTHFNTTGYVQKNKVSVQVAARELRYAWFKEIMSEHGLGILVTAHHADDNLETFLINLSRGAGIDGLTGIPVKSNNVYRPLLKYSREQILEYAQKNGVQWREDESNKDTKYLRNKIRLNIIPKLKELHPTFLHNFNNTQKYLNQTQAIAKNELENIKGRLFVEENGIIKIPVNELKKLKPLEAYLYGLLSDYGFTEWNNVMELLDSMSGKQVCSENFTLLKDREYLMLFGTLDNENVEYTIEEGTSNIQSPIKLEFSVVEENKENVKNVIFLDKNTLKYPLKLRKWKKGDYFYPLGFHGKKKLSKYFKDEKMDLLAKEAQWLLCSNDEIVWVIGRRADDRFKIKDSTTKILRVALKI